MSNPENYTVGWISAILTEYVAAQELLDEEHEPPGFVQPNDNNHYKLGKIGKHNIVMAVLPDGEYGTDSAASVATNMLGSFPNIRIGLRVGIGGGAPSGKHDIRLGDIVVSAPRDGEGGVFQYDFGKTVQDQVFQNTRFLDQPPRTLRTAVTGIQAQYKRRGHQLEQIIDAVLEKNPRLQQDYQRPPPDTDRLFQADFIHDPRGCAEFCAVNPTNLVPRRERTEHEDNPAIHYGTIASANQLMKDAFIRNKLASGKNVLCFEMEAAGLMNHFPCLVIRGICDYSDSHKNKEWQGYAALAAAAYAKDLLLQILPDNVKAEKRINEFLSSGQSTGAEDTKEEVQSLRVDLLRQIHERANDPSADAIFWLNGMAGTGKSTISRTVARDFAKSGHLGASFFFKRGETDRGNLAKFVPTVARQLAWSIPGIVPFIKKGIDADPDIVGKAVREQFEKLIREPLSRAVATPSTPLSVVMVIDALDECDQEADIRLLINIFSLAKTLRPHLRVFLTSRPELPIRLGFGEVQGSYQDLVLHDISAQVVEHDIIVFLDDEFKKIRHDFNMTVGDERKLPPDWPGRPIVQRLARMAVPLFIFAATVCRFVGDRKRDSPPVQLRKVLDYEIKGHVSQLDRTYGPVLRSLITDVSENDKTQIINDFKMIVGSIVILANPLSVWAFPQHTFDPESACAATTFVISRLPPHKRKRAPGR
ncbi:G beta WD-40 repeats containing protein [Fusarium mundagurra]|uniref:G beta WD-40 repeats containing protein n=1 Tax=Fusarium mundagurra TaxID=1567541 RepID=A0A8H6CZR9_9HYPO|nr:G beta WD-40 repeats containing protein [Fusarium mundagurra]